MAKINNKSKYPFDINLSLDDFIIGSDADNADVTRNYKLSGLFATFKTSLNLASIEYTFSDGTDPDLDESDIGYFTTNSNETSAPAVTAININKQDSAGLDITSLLNVVDDQPTSFVLRLFKPSVTGQVFYFAISDITDNGDDTYTLTVSNFVGANSLQDGTTYGFVFDLAGVPSIYSETDPIFTASAAFDISSTQISNWNTAFGWGDHNIEGYLKPTDSTTITGTWGFEAVSQMQFVPQASPTYSEGVLWYSSADNTFSFYNPEADVTVNIGEKSMIRVRNTSGTLIPNGSAVYASGSTGNRVNIALAQANSLSTSRVIGVATHDIENNSDGYITVLGVVNNLDTSAFSGGDELFLSPTVAGGITNTKPQSPNETVAIGECLVSNPSVGNILVQLRPLADTAVKALDQTIDGNWTFSNPLTVETGSITGVKIDTWDLAYSWGDHAVEGYLTSETDPVFSASAAFAITSADITQWDAAYSWGDHGVVGYLLPSDIDTIAELQALVADTTIWHSGNLTPSDYVLKSGDTMTGSLVIDGGTALNEFSINREVELENFTARLAIGGGVGAGQTILYNINNTAGEDSRLYIYSDGRLVFYDNGTQSDIWHSGNDGAGSGLDADLFDSLDSSQFLRSDVNDTMQGVIILDNSSAEVMRIYGTSTGDANRAFISIYESNGTTRQGYFGFESISNSDLTLRNDVTGQNIVLDGAGGNNGVQFFDGTTTRTVWHEGNLTPSDYVLKSGDTMSGALVINANLTAQIGTFTGNINAKDGLFTRDSIAVVEVIGVDGVGGVVGTDTNHDLILRRNNVEALRVGSSGLTTYSGAKIWTESNDGAGSGLDADLLDGVDLSSIARTDVSEETFGGVLRTNSTNAIIAGVDGEGTVGLTLNDGQGNANLTFNHVNGIADKAGNVGRISMNVDSTSNPNMSFEIAANAATGAVTSIPVLGLYETYTQVADALRIEGGEFILKQSTDRPGVLLLDSINAARAWYGFQIKDDGGQLWSMMGNAGTWGVYDDTNNKWALKYNINNSVDLYYNGSIKIQTSNAGATVTGDVTANDFVLSSDERKKKDVKVIGKSSLGFDWVSYRYKDGENRVRYGAIANDVIQTEYSSAVTTDEEDFYKLSYIDLLVADSSKKTEIIENQDKKIRSLEERIERLEKLIK